MNRAGFARIAAIEAVVAGARELEEKRAAVQQARRRSDESVAELFVDTFRPSFPHPELKTCQDELVDAFKLRELFP